MLFQNPPEVPSGNLIMSSKPQDVVRDRTLPNEFPYQKVIEPNRSFARGTIPVL